MSPPIETQTVTKPLLSIQQRIKLSLATQLMATPLLATQLMSTPLLATQLMSTPLLAIQLMSTPLLATQLMTKLLLASVVATKPAMHDSQNHSTESSHCLQENSDTDPILEFRDTSNSIQDGQTDTCYKTTCATQIAKVIGHAPDVATFDKLRSELKSKQMTSHIP